MTDVPAPTAPKPTAPPRAIRWWGFLVIFLLILATAVLAPWWLSSFLRAKIDTALASQGWELDPAHPLSISIYGARISGEDLTLRMIADQRVLMQAKRLSADVAVTESLQKRDLVIAELVADGVVGSLRRGPDGRPPLVAEEPVAPGAPLIDWKKVDWKANFQKGMDQYQEWQAKREADLKLPKDQPAPRPAPEADIDWPQAVKHQPAPTVGRHIPRVVVRKLSITGGKVPMPDEGPLDIASFSLTGSDVALRQDQGEVMLLKAEITTEGAGPITLDLTREQIGNGRLNFAAPTMPLQALSSPAIAGDSLAPWGPTGTAAITGAQTWTGWALNGTVEAQVSGLALQPTPGAPSEAKTAAKVIAALKGKPIRWPVVIGGTLTRPEIVDSGLKKVLEENQGVLIEAAKEEAKDKALEKGSQLIDKELKKHPEAEKAKDAAKDALKNLLGR